MMRAMGVLLILSGLLLSTARGEAGEPSAAGCVQTVAPFLDDQTVAVLHADFSRVQVNPLIDRAVELVPELAEYRQPARLALGAVLGAFQMAGGKDLYMVVSLADVNLAQEPQFPLVVPLYEGANAEALLAPLKEVPYDVKQRQGNVLLACSREALKRFETQPPAERPELLAAWEAVADSMAQAILIPTADNRRVIEEMLPELPPQIGGGSSRVFTRGVKWAAVGISPPPQLSLRLVIQSEDAATAGALHEKWTLISRLIQQHLPDEVPELRPHAGTLEKALALLTPQVQDDRLVLVLDENNGGIQQLIAILKPPLQAARAQAQRMVSINQLKQIALAMHNYHDQHKHFPPAASRDAEGKPLLSWRVLLLPYMGQKSLYEQFHLDQPWDSLHNRSLIEKIPDIYRSPEILVTDKGRTCLVVPVGEGTPFAKAESLSVKQITDGTSATILAVEVDQQHAVIWTKPDDLPFDPQHPLQRLKIYDGRFPAAFYDGSVHQLSAENPPEVLRALFTPAGGEAVEPAGDGKWRLGSK